jgi:MFS family permease
VNSLTTFYAALAVVGLGSSLGGFMPIAATVTQWFARRRSTALGITLSGMGAGGMMVPLVVSLIASHGWRWMATLSAVLIAALALPAAQFMRSRPEAYGQRVDGLPEPTPRFGSDSVVLQEPAFTARQALRTRTFWMLSLVHASALLIVGAVLVHLIPHMVEGIGMSTTAAGSVIVVLVVVMCGQLLGGWIGDRVNKRLIIFAYTDSYYGAVLFAILHGAAWGVRGTLINSIRADYFGSSSFATISGFSSLVIMIGMTSGPLFSGIVYDLTGSYRGAFVTLAALAAVASIAALLARPPIVTPTTELAPGTCGYPQSAVRAPGPEPITRVRPGRRTRRPAQ